MAREEPPYTSAVPITVLDASASDEQVTLRSKVKGRW
jgi:hypothetical protein